MVFRGILDAEPAEIKKKPPSMTRVDGAVKRVINEALQDSGGRWTVVGIQKTGLPFM